MTSEFTEVANAMVRKIIVVGGGASAVALVSKICVAEDVEVVVLEQGEIAVRGVTSVPQRWAKEAYGMSGSSYRQVYILLHAIQGSLYDGNSQSARLFPSVFACCVCMCLLMYVRISMPVVSACVYSAGFNLL
jgi:hypothetical protein